jgi:hypothetical protein
MADELQPAHAAVERWAWDRALELLDRLVDAGRNPCCVGAAGDRGLRRRAVRGVDSEEHGHGSSSW